MKGDLHHYGLVRFSKKNGKIDKTLTAIGNGLLQLYALQNTPKNKACLIIDIDDQIVYREYVGTESGFPDIHKYAKDTVYQAPKELFVELKKMIENE